MNPRAFEVAPFDVTANVLSYSKRSGTNGLTCEIQESTDLGVADAWAAVVPTIDNASTISFTLPVGTAKGFIRLKVSSN